MSKLLKAWLNEDTGEIMSPKMRLVFRPALFTAVPNPKVPGSKNKFSCVALIPADADIEAIKNEIYRAAEETHGKKWKEIKLRKPLVKTADEFPRLAEYAEAFPYALKPSANEDFPPTVFGPDAKPFKGDKSEVYGGRWCVISGAAWGYTTGSLGVGWNLNRVQLLDHDERLGSAGGITSASGFDAADIGAPAGGGKPASTDDIF